MTNPACARRRLGTATWIARSRKREIRQYRPPLNPVSAAPSPAANTAASHSPSRESFGWPTAYTPRYFGCRRPACTSRHTWSLSSPVDRITPCWRAALV
jgi:hypothetical protein